MIWNPARIAVVAVALVLESAVSHAQVPAWIAALVVLGLRYPGSAEVRPLLRHGRQAAGAGFLDAFEDRFVLFAKKGCELMDVFAQVRHRYSIGIPIEQTEHEAEFGRGHATNVPFLTLRRRGRKPGPKFLWRRRNRRAEIAEIHRSSAPLCGAIGAGPARASRRVAP